MTDPILIVGGGIGGLTTALALLRQGVPVAVFEAAAAIGDVGAGLTLGATATRGLYALGLEDALMAAAPEQPSASAALHYQTGEVLGGGFKDRAWTTGNPDRVHSIHRADLYTILQDAVLALAPDALHLGHVFERFEQDPGGVTLWFEDGTTTRGRALIGADGIRSPVRTQMFGPETPRFTGQVAYRFLVPMEKALPFMGASIAGPYIGPGRSLMRYPLRHNTIVNCVVFASAESWTGEGWSERCSVAELQDLFPGWHADVLGLAASAPIEGTAKWALYDRDPLDTWVKGRVALLGDAAHPMLPFLGLGAAMAIEDAVVLARAFAKLPEPCAALQLYESARVTRAGQMLLESRRQADLFREGPGGEKQRTLTTHSERMAYDPSTVPL